MRVFNLLLMSIMLFSSSCKSDSKVLPSNDPIFTYDVLEYEYREFNNMDIKFGVVLLCVNGGIADKNDVYEAIKEVCIEENIVVCKFLFNKNDWQKGDISPFYNDSDFTKYYARIDLRNKGTFWFKNISFEDVYFFRTGIMPVKLKLK